MKVSVRREDKEMKSEIMENAMDVQEIKESETDVESTHTSPLTAEVLYAKELESLLDSYIEYTATYKKISKMVMNPIKMRKQAMAIYKQLSELGERFNEAIYAFREKAVVPSEDLQPIHDKILDSLGYFEVYNKEFPELMRGGNIKRVHQLSQGLEKGQRGMKEAFDALEERENQKVRQ